MENNCTSIICQVFVLSQETQNKLEKNINEVSNNIYSEMLLTRVDKNQIYFPYSLNFTNSELSVIYPICYMLNQFLMYDNQAQIKKINEFIQNYIKTNIDDFLINVIPTFGNQFFERIIDYNINFKLIDLYQNLHYALGQSLLYYHSLDIIGNKEALPFDLKIRLYKLNDLDVTVENKKNQISNLLGKKLSKLINELKNMANEIYSYYILENNLIKRSFSSKVFKKIKCNLEEIMPDIEIKYQEVLEEYLKEKFINSFTDVLDKESKEMIDVFNQEKNNLTQRLDYLFSSKEDKDLNEINKDINNTLMSIKDYKTYSSYFSFSYNFRNYYKNFSNEKLLPLFQKFNSDLNENFKKSIKDSINNKSLEIERLNSSNFFDKKDYVSKYLIQNYFDEIAYGIIDYGMTEEDYRNNLSKIIEQNKDNFRRRLVDFNNEEEILEESKRILNLKDVKEAFEELTSKFWIISNDIKTSIFNDFEEIIKNYKNNLIVENDKLKYIIEENRYDYDINLFLNEKLDNLTNNLFNYYENINSSYFELKNTITIDILIISWVFNILIDNTKKVLNEEYINISNLVDRNELKISNEIINPIFNRYGHQSENFIINSTHTISNIAENALFKLDLFLEGNDFLYPKFQVRIENRIIPKYVNFILKNNFSFCIQKSHIYTIYLPDVNYNTILEYNTKSSFINITNYGYVDKYNFSITEIEIPEAIDIENLKVMNYNISNLKCFNNTRDRKNNFFYYEVEAKNITGSKIIDK